jgi:hypothetical protein
MAAEQTEWVTPNRIAEGDVVADQLGERWLTVKEITVESNGDRKVFGFYGDSPDDRVSFEDSEHVQRRKR